ncbi:universal stress protein [Castellaniella defragrans]|jgi:nucleotide-binding universal stress UspA family protein|uniref:UspA domain protein n=2 Tax=Castellaniella defragrans TaxID=75697 RepID=W8X047_CASD6|nr:universal stress protein [Castellaniella defragrans]MBB6085162.1 nucleotide-binding universal stress UspA family protein [Castellaniella defragrans]CDM25224.1 UspA domain protein [Castellaniella defragrans 65Phen]
MPGRIAIHLNDDTVCERRMDIGLRLAREREAEVVGVYPSASVAGLQQDENILPQDIRNSLRKRRDEHREATRTLFLDKAREAGVRAHWRAPHGDSEDGLTMHARHCDLLLMSKADPNDNLSALRPNLPESVVMASGRPVLLIPNFGPIDTIGRRILFCWDQRREAARAFSDAAPLLRHCQALVVLEIDRDDKLMRERDIHEDDFSDYCVSLGYPKPRHLLKDSKGYGVGNVILNTATDTDTDLIVMGAYGHSRMRQWIMGGATSTLLASMTVPVLLAN